MNAVNLARSVTVLFVVLIAPSLLLASTTTEEGEEEDAAIQVVSGIALPHWVEGEYQESFDVRIWPGAVKIWLEQENLRSLISDPATPEAERQSLKRILALQRAWRSKT